VDEVVMRRPNFSPVGFLGDHSQPTLVDAHLEAARTAMGTVRSELDRLEPHRSLRHPLGRIEGADLRDLSIAKATVHNELVAAHSELQRLLPDEVDATVIDDGLRGAVARLSGHVDQARAAASDVTHWQLRDTVDIDLLRSQVETLEGRVRVLADAPALAAGGEHLAASQLPEFDALITRLQSGSFLTRGDTMRVFPYSKFGRTAAERMRNFGVAMEALDARVGFGDRGVGRLKSWMRDLAVDAGTVRRELGADQRDLDTLLAQVEDHAARNGRDGVVVNAAGKMGYEDFPDYAEVGAMGAALRTYVAVDDAGRLAVEAAPTPPADVLSW
jgi:hypothetical protein